MPNRGILCPILLESHDINQGFILGLLSSDRPTCELLAPRRQDQRLAFENQFEGMTNIEFSYEEYVDTREHLIKTVNQCMTEDDKQFLFGINSLEPRWSYYDFERFPAIQWKLQNLIRLQSIDQEKFKKQFSELELILYS